MSDTVYDYDHASSASVPGSVSGTIDGAAYSYYYGYSTQDEDWYAYSLNAGSIYTFSLVNSGMDGYLYLYDSDFNFLDSVDSYGEDYDETLTFTADSSSTYYVAVGAYYEYDYSRGYYTWGAGNFTLTSSSYTPATSADYVGDSMYAEDVGALDAITTVTGAVDPAEYDYYGDYTADEDWYAVSMSAGMTYDFTLVNHGFDGFFALFDEDGYWQTYGDSYGAGSTDTMSFTPMTSGTYYVGVTGNYDYSYYDYGYGDFELSMTSYDSGISSDDAVGDHWSSSGSFGSISVSSSVTGVINGEVYSDTWGYYGDEDWYSVSLASGTTYRFSLDNSAMDGFLYLYDSSYDWVASGDTYGNGSDDTMYFTPTASGTYFVAVGANWDYGIYDFGRGTFTLNLDTFSTSTGGGDTVGDFWYSPSSYGSVSVGGSVTGAINGLLYSSTYNENYADEDWYAVNLTAGMTYQFNLTNFSMDGYVVLYGTSGDWLTWGDTWGTGSTDFMYFTPDATGTYYVDVGANWDYDNDSYGSGSFSLDVSAFSTSGGGEDVVGDYWYSTDNFGELNAPGQVFGTIDGGLYSTTYDELYADEDWYQVSLTAGSTYQISLTNFEMDGYLAVYDTDAYSLTWGDSWGVGSTDTVYFSPDTTGVYFIDVGANWDYDAYDYGRGSFTLAVSSFTVGSESNDTVGGFNNLWAYTDAGGWIEMVDPNDEGEINAPGQVFGSINAPIVLSVAGNTYENADQDWFGVTLTAGNTYQFGLTNFDMDGWIELRDSSGSLETWADEWGEGETDTLYFTASTSGTYYVAVGANWEYGSYDDSTGWYGDYGQGDFTLSVSVFEETITDTNDIAGDEQTLGTLSESNHVRSQVSVEDDSDWFALALDGDSIYTFSVSALTLDSTLTLYDEYGNFVSYTDVGGSGSSETLTVGPGFSGTYYLAVDGWYDSIGSYDLSMSSMVSNSIDIAGGVTPAADEQAAGLTTPGCYFSSISPDDADWFNVRLEAGTSYRFDLYADYTLDGILALYDSRGAEVVDANGYSAYADDSWYGGGTETLYFTPETSGEYFLDVSGWDNSYGSYGVYVSETSAWSLDNGYDGIKWETLDWSTLSDYGSVDWSQVDWDKISTWNTLDWTSVDWAEIYASGMADGIDYAAIDWSAIDDADFWDSDYFNNSASISEEEWVAIVSGLSSDKAGQQTFFTSIDDGTDGSATLGLDLADDGNDCIILSSDSNTKSVSGGVGLDYLQAADGVGATLDGGRGADFVVGGSGKDIGKGGEGNDVVEGGAGADKLEGGAGNDVIYGSDADGSDSTGDSLKGDAGKDVLQGSHGADKLDGGDGADVLDGGGGADAMKGGKGADIYYVNNAGDKCTDVSGDDSTLNADDLQGSVSGALSDLTAIKDKVVATISYVLATNLEDLSLEGSGNLDATGNKVANELIGNSGNNRLDGKEASDILTGGAGNDTFVFSTKIGVSNGVSINSDTITDFSVGEDAILLKSTIFKAKFSSDGSSFYSGTNAIAAVDANDFLIYNQTLGDLYYDADGSGTKSSAIKIATLVGAPDDLSWDDFSIG